MVARHESSIENDLIEDVAIDGGLCDAVGAIGRSLKLAARRPAESFVYLVGERPAVVCWGYEKEDAPTVLPANLPRVVAEKLISFVPPALNAPKWFRSMTPP